MLRLGRAERAIQDAELALQLNKVSYPAIIDGYIVLISWYLFTVAVPLQTYIPSIAAMAEARYLNGQFEKSLACYERGARHSWSEAQAAR